jgi:hypothetical protein
MVSRVSGLFLVLSIALFTAFLSSQESPTSFAWMAEDDSVGWSCWSIGVTDPCQLGFNRVDFLDRDYGWALGRGGRAWSWNGSVWQEANIPNMPIDLTLVALSVVSETDVWVAGGRLNTSTYTHDTVFFHWNGYAWQEIVVPPSEDIGLIRNVAMTSGDFGLAVGRQGILRWDGAEWTKLYDNPANAVDLLTADEGWIVGPDMLLLHWNGISLTTHDYPFGAFGTLNDVHVLASDEVWIISGARDIGRWNGKSWLITPAPPEAGVPRVINMASSNDGWIAVADTVAGSSWGQLWRWNGDQWTVANEYIPPLFQYRSLTDIYMFDETAGWLVGSPGLILYWDGQSWNTVDGEPLPQWRPETTFHAIDAISPTAVWAVGYAPLHEATIVRWDGQQWTPQPVSVSNPIYIRNLLRNLAMFSETKGWAVGVGGIVLQWDGSVWQDVETLNSHGDLYAIDIVDEDQFWVVGIDNSYPGGGLIWQWSGGSWQSFDSGVSATLRDVSMLNAGEGWAVGDNGTILHWDGNDWSTVINPITARLNAVFALASDNVWVAGVDAMYNGVIAHWDGNEWQQVALQEGVERLNDIYFLTPDNGLAVGDSAILRWNGMTWQKELSQATPESYAGILVGPNEGWAVGRRFMSRGLTPPGAKYTLYLPLVSR